MSSYAISYCFPKKVSIKLDRLFDQSFTELKNLSPFLLDSNCEHCRVRKAMQNKYVGEMMELYAEDFHIVRCPLLTEEVRGVEKIQNFSRFLVEPYSPPSE